MMTLRALKLAYMPRESHWRWVSGRAEPLVTVEGWERWLRTHPRLKVVMDNRPGEACKHESG